MALLEVQDVQVNRVFQVNKVLQVPRDLQVLRVHEDSRAMPVVQVLTVLTEKLEMWVHGVKPKRSALYSVVTRNPLMLPVVQEEQPSSGMDGRCCTPLETTFTLRKILDLLVRV